MNDKGIIYILTKVLRGQKNDFIIVLFNFKN